MSQERTGNEGGPEQAASDGPGTAAQRLDGYRRLFELSADLLGIATMAGFFVELSPSWEKTLGFSREELRKSPFLTFVHPEDQASTLGEVAKLSEGAHVLNFRNRYRAKDGSYRWIDWTSVPSDGHIYFVARDVSESVRMEEEQRGALALLERKNQELEHEIDERRQAEAALSAQEEALSALSAPILQVGDGVLLLPVVGQISATRTAMMMSKLLDAIVQSSADVTILDLTGVGTVDAETANHLFSLVSAARLLGSECLVSGIRPGIATIMVDLGIDHGTLRTFGTLAAALSHAFGRRGRRER